jgi:hypothetical protein
MDDKSKIKIMPNSAETETELYGKALDCVTEYLLISIWNNWRKETQKDYWDDLEKFREYRVYTGRQTPKALVTKKDALISCIFQVLLNGVQTWSIEEKEKEQKTPKLSSGRWNEE